VDQAPVWSPDGARIIFERGRTGKFSLRQQAIDATPADESVLERSTNTGGIAASSWSADGRFIAYTHSAAFPLRSDVWVLPLFGDRKPFPLTRTDNFLETSGAFSPDGRWIAYTTDEAGQPNIAVQSFPQRGRTYAISKDGGTQPVWRADGKELFYLRADGAMMAVSIQTAGEFTAGTPQALFPTGVVLTGLPQFNRGHAYAVRKDGQRFLVNARLPEAAPLTVVLNWIASIH
jgi:Tol biopolymer transport system component